MSLLELCESLAQSQANERKAIDMMFEREMKQEKNLEARERDLRRQKAQSEVGGTQFPLSGVYFEVIF